MSVVNKFWSERKKNLSDLFIGYNSADFTTDRKTENNRRFNIQIKRILAI